MRESPQIGQIVRSRAGRDKGKTYLVIRVLDERYVELADGSVRSVTDPKRKNILHLAPAGPPDVRVMEGLASGKGATNDEIIRALASIQS